MTLSLSAPQVRGSLETTFVNTSDAALQGLVIMLFPNRFALPDAGVDDVNRPYVYPSLDFVPGWMDLGVVRVDGVIAETVSLDAAGLPPSCARCVLLPSPLPPGGATRVRLDFATYVPERFGSFGEFDDMITAVGGWYPYLAALRRDGSWAPDGLPPRTDFDVELTADTQLDVLLNGRALPALAAPVRVAVDDVHYLALAAAPKLLRDSISSGETRIVSYRRPPGLAHRISLEPSRQEILQEALKEILARRPAAAPAELVVVEAPLRLDLTAPGEGMVVISDRALEVAWLIRPFHQAQLAKAAYEELDRPALAQRESVDDYTWVSDGLAHEQARRYYAAAHADTRSVQSWIDLFNVFAIVDRFETAPKIPFISAFFERQPVPDPLHQQIWSYNNDRPAGHVVFGKLRQLVGEEAFHRIVDLCGTAAAPFRECAAQASGRDLDAFFTEWLQPYPELDYSLEDIELNRREPGDDAGFVDRFTVVRHSSRLVHEPVAVRLRSIGGNAVDLRWDGSGDAGRLTAQAPFRVWQVVIDPDRKLIERTRVDNASPPQFQLVLDSAEVQVSSTEFGFSALAVARARYDYRKDLAAAFVWTNRGIGGTAGGRYHWGERIDDAAFRNNLYLFYVVEALDRSFKDDRHPDVITAGHINGVGVRYDYDNILSYDNPTHEVKVNLFTDWYGGALGSDYDYVDWGGDLVLTHPLWSDRTVLAGEIFNGFSEPLGPSTVPNQGLYSLGGARSIRGIGAEEELARNIFLVRAELRQTLLPELDLNMLDLLILRRLQLRGFVDSGQVSNSAGATYDPRGYAVGIGGGLGAVYDFMGFFPSLAYVELATRVDGPGSGVQFLFGTRQAF